MRGVSARWLRHLHGDWRIWRNGDGLAVSLAGVVPGEVRRGPQAAGHRGEPCAAAAAP
jgi:hypothetical protein